MLKPKELFCITHGRMEHVEYGEITGLPAHEVLRGFIHEFEMISWCTGPFASCPPPEMTEEIWDAVFANEESVRAMLDEIGSENEQS